MLREATRPLDAKRGGGDSMLDESCPVSVRHWLNVTREPFQARRRRARSVLEYQFVLERKLPRRARSLIISAVPSASEFVYAKRLLRSSSCVALATNTAEAFPLRVDRPVCWTVLFHRRPRADVCPVVSRTPCWKRPWMRLYCTVTGAGLSDSTMPKSPDMSRLLATSAGPPPALTSAPALAPIVLWVIV